MRNKLKKVIKPKHTPLLEPTPLPSGYQKKRFAPAKKEIIPPITYYPNVKKD